VCVCVCVCACVCVCVCVCMCVCVCVCVYVCVCPCVCIYMSVGYRGCMEVDIEMQDNNERDSQNFMRKRKRGKLRYPLIHSQEVGAWVR
jgi:hypothetical protein